MQMPYATFFPPFTFSDHRRSVQECKACLLDGRWHSRSGVDLPRYGVILMFIASLPYDFFFFCFLFPFSLLPLSLPPPLLTSFLFFFPFYLKNLPAFAYIKNLYILNELLTLYGVDSDITHIIDSMDIYVLPVFNVDGYTFS